MPNSGFNHQDAGIPDLSAALPNGAATTYSAGIKVSQPGYAVLDDFELNISAPALGATPLPDAKTMIYSLQHDDDPAFGTVADLDGYRELFRQLGAGGVGAVAKSNVRVRLPSSCKAYVRLKMVGSASGDASGASATIGRRF